MLKAHPPVCLLAVPILAMPATDANTARGRYLVESIAIGQHCRSPRGPDGQCDKTRWLKGASIDFKPDNPMPWAVAAPDITASGKHPQPPMPAYRFNARDAKAAVEYLKTLH